MPNVHHHSTMAASSEPAMPYSCPRFAIPDTIVTAPIGMHPKKSECVSCDSINLKKIGYRAYRRTVKIEKQMNRKMSPRRNAAPIPRNAAWVACHGSRNSNVLTMPVPYEHAASSQLSFGT